MITYPIDTTDGPPDAPIGAPREEVDALLGQLPPAALEPFMLRAADDLETINRDSPAPAATAETGTILSFPSSREEPAVRSMARPPQDVPLAASVREPATARPSPFGRAVDLATADRLPSFLASPPAADSTGLAVDLASSLAESSSLLLDMPDAGVEEVASPLDPTRQGDVAATFNDLTAGATVSRAMLPSGSMPERAIPRGGDLVAMLPQSTIEAGDVLSQIDSAVPSPGDATLRFPGGGAWSPGFKGSAATRGPAGSTYAAWPAGGWPGNSWGDPAMPAGPSATDAFGVGSATSSWDVDGAIDHVSGAAARLLDAASRLEQAAERIESQRPHAYTSSPPPFRGRIDG